MSVSLPPGGPEKERASKFFLVSLPRHSKQTQLLNGLRLPFEKRVKQIGSERSIDRRRELAVALAPLLVGIKSETAESPV